MIRIAGFFLTVFFHFTAHAQHTVRFEHFDSAVVFRDIGLGAPYNIIKYKLRLTPAGYPLRENYFINSKNYLTIEGMEADYGMAYFNHNTLFSLVWGINKARYSSITVLSFLSHAFGFNDLQTGDSSFTYHWKGKNIEYYADTVNTQNNNIILVGIKKIALSVN